MSDERRDDEIIGRALSRAIETQTPNETPFERSRIGSAPPRRGFPIWQTLGVAATLVLALAFGSWFTRPTDRAAVASSSTPSVAPTIGGTASPTPAGSAATVATRVFFVRDLLPPVSADLLGGGAHIAVDQVIERIAVARAAASASIPGGAANPVALIGAPGTLNMSATINGDTARVEFELSSGWGVHGAAQVQALVQQLVYLITEQPGIRRAQIVEKGKANAVIDGLVVDKPLSREDVTDYDHVGSTTTAKGFGDASAAASRKLTTRISVDTVASALARFVVDTDLQSPSPTESYPDFKVEVFANDELAGAHLPGKWRMDVTVNGQDTALGNQLEWGLVVNKSPITVVHAAKQTCPGCAGTVYSIYLDDLRPWRTAIAFNPFRIIVDIGGDPRMISGDTNAVYAPAYGAAVARTFQVSGIAHNFEAHVVIRVLDDKQKEIYKGSTTATNCCDPGGTFDATVTLPASVSGNVYLEVFEASARDGSAVKLIRVPLTVR